MLLTPLCPTVKIQGDEEKVIMMIETAVTVIAAMTGMISTIEKNINIKEGTEMMTMIMIMAMMMTKIEKGGEIGGGISIRAAKENTNHHPVGKEVVVKNREAVKEEAEVIA